MFTGNIRYYVALSLLLLVSTAAQGMTLNEYLGLVKKDSLIYKSNNEKTVGLDMQLSEADLYYTPTFFTDANYMDTSQPQNPPFFIGRRQQQYQVGVSQTFRSGLEAKVFYEMIGIDMQVPGALGSIPGFNMRTSYWDTAPKLELKMPLWSGGFGRRIRATEETLRKQVVAEKFNSEYQSLDMIAKAEANYWKLSIWQEVVDIQEQALQAARNILDHVKRKRGMNLGEESDVVQAQALVEGKRLELKMANDEKRAALRAFNRFANRHAYDTVNNLEKVDYAKLSSFEIPAKRPGDRADVRALQAQAEFAIANAKLARERGKPTLDLVGNFSMHGQRDSFSDSSEESLRNRYNTTFVGVNFSVPLFFGALSDLETGALKVQKAAELSKEAAAYNQEQEWIQLVESLKDIRENLKLLTKLEDVQKRKLDVERRRFKQGRTTVFQVLMFEQDYSAASVTRAKLASEILGLSTQLQLYIPVKGSSL